MRAGLAQFIASRAVAVVPVWIGISLLSFAITDLAPGDPVEIMLQRQADGPPSAVEIERLRSELGLDAPFPVRYARWASGALQGDLGTSYRSDTPVFENLAAALPFTLRLTLAALGIGFAIAIPIGVAAAVRRNSLLDHVSRAVAVTGASLPGFVIGYFLILVFAVHLRWLPVAGSGDIAHFALPAFTLGVMEAAALMRLTRARMLDVLRADYMRSARAKGASELRVVVRHGLRNVLNPLVTLGGIRFAKLLGGAVIIETLFARPGVGKLIVEAIFDRDFPMIQGFVLFTGTLFVATNLLVDLSYAWLNPRVKLSADSRSDA